MDTPSVLDRCRVQAERALLGAVLLDPAAQQRVLDLVQPDDMRLPWHAQVLEAMQRVRAREAFPDPMAVYAELQNDPDLPATVSQDGVLVADLMEAAPTARHARAYAALVIEGSLREQVHMAGTRVVQAAGTRQPELVLRRAADGTSILGECQARWRALPEPFRRELSAPTGPAAFGVWASRLPAIGEAEPARPDGPAARAAGHQALRDLAAAPSYLRPVARWLRPEHFAREEQGQLYAVMRDMDAAGRAVDPVTVSWEAARHGLTTDLHSLAGGFGPLAVASARDVHRHGMLAQAAQAGRAIQADAADPAYAPGQLLKSAADRLRNLRAQPHSCRAPARSQVPETSKALPSQRPQQAEREAV